MKIDLLTLFPAMANGVLAESILGRAQRAGLVEIRVHQIRDYAKDKHHTVDDRPFGGGPGMVMKAEPLVDAIEHLRGEGEGRAHVIYVTPEGARLDQAKVVQLGREHRHLLLISGHYEGIDERVREGWIDEEISVGDYVLSNGTLPALTLIDAMVRLIPGVLGNESSASGDSFGEEGFWKARSTLDPRSFGGGKCRKFCSRAIMPRSANGKRVRLWPGRGSEEGIYLEIKNRQALPFLRRKKYERKDH